jgi:hypothetical protein
VGGTVIDSLAIALVVLALGLAVWAAVAALLDRSPHQAHLFGVGLLELLLVAQAVVAVVLLVGGDRPGSLVTFVGYLVVALAVLPLGVLWALSEPGRWGIAVVAAACFVVAVLVVRMQQVWDGASA